MGGGGTTVVEAPDPVNPAQVGRDTLQTQLDLAPQVFAANAEYLPRYATLANDVAGQMLPGLLQQQSTANTAQRTADIADVRNLAADALAAWQAANPNLTRAQGALETRIDAAAGRAVPQVGSYQATATPTAVANATANATQAAPVQSPTLGAASQIRAAQAATPGLSAAMQADAQRALGSVSPLQIQLQRQAMEQLGADLSPAQLAKVQQDTRAAYQARGLYDSNRAIGAEILNTDAARSQRLATAQQFALGVDQAGQQATAANRAYAGQVSGQAIDLSQFNAGQRQQAGLANQAANNQFALTRYGTEADAARLNAQLSTQVGLANADAANRTSLANADAANRASLADTATAASLGQFNAGLAADRDRTNASLVLGADQQAVSNYFNLANQYASTAQDPYQLVLGRSGAPAAAAGLTSSAGPTMFDPFNPAVTQIYAANTANQLAANTATANNNAAVRAGGLSALGSLGGAGIMALALCWVARAAYGPDNPRWLQFRDYVVHRAPPWFSALYVLQGPAAGRHIARRPRLAARVRELMDQILTANNPTEVCHA